MSENFKEKAKYYTKEIVITALLILVVTNLISFFRAPDIDQNLPQFEMILTNGDSFSTVKSMNQPTLIHFWATWCPTCKLEAPNIQALSEEYNVITIAVSSKSNTHINHYLKENTLDFKVINDDEGKLAETFNVSVFPTTFIFDKNNKLSFADVGYTSTWGLKVRMWWAGI